MILGLDISSSITGICILSDKGRVILSSAIDLRKKKGFFEKIVQVETVLNDIKQNYDIKSVYIEQPFMFFNSGGSSAKTMATLQKVNGTVSWLCYSIFDIEPEYFSAAQARKSVGIKIKRGENTKKSVLEFVLDNCDEFEVEYTSRGNPKPETYDRADGWVIAKAGWNQCKSEQS